MEVGAVRAVLGEGRQLETVEKWTISAVVPQTDDERRASWLGAEMQWARAHEAGFLTGQFPTPPFLNLSLWSLCSFWNRGCNHRRCI